MKFCRNLNSLPTFDAAMESRKLVIFGAGNLCMKCLNTFLRGRTDGIRYIVDNNTRLHGTRLYGLNVLSPDTLAGENPDETIILIASGDVAAVMRQIGAHGDFDVFSGDILVDKTKIRIAADLFGRRKELEQVESMLHDEMSRRIFPEVVYRRLVGDENWADLRFPEAPEHILREFFQDDCPKDEIIIDCGAAAGDSLANFVRVFENALVKYYAFEPAPETHKKLAQNVRRYAQRDYAPEIILMPYGVFDEAGVVDFHVYDRPGGSFIAKSRDFAQSSLWNSEKRTIETVRLDDVIPADEKITLIKMDVEGSEHPALIGAERLIKTHKPRLAVSLYHRGDDYYRIALLLREWIPEYKFAVRHHSKSHVDTMLYAWI